MGLQPGQRGVSRSQGKIGYGSEPAPAPNVEASTGRVDFSHKQPVRWGTKSETWGVPVMEVLPHTGWEEGM